MSDQNQIDELNSRIQVLYQAKGFLQANNEKSAVRGVERAIGRYQQIIEDYEEAQATAKQEVAMAFEQPCPACSGKRAAHIQGQVYTCQTCGCLFGTCYLGESYQLVRPQMKAGEVAGAVPFDLMTLGSVGIGRRHGFYDPSDRLITQVG